METAEETASVLAGNDAGHRAFGGGEIGGSGTGGDVVGDLTRAYVEGKLHPTILVGLGGLGTAAIEAIYLRLLRTYGHLHKVMNVFQFLAIDTRRGGQVKHVLPLSCYYELGGFDGRRYVKVRGREDEAFAEAQPHLASGQLYPSRYMDRGAGGHRADGHLALMRNYERIREAVRRARDLAVDVLDSQAVQCPSVTVYVCNSISGGTGSGMANDVAFMIRDLLSGCRVRIYSFSMTPAVVDLMAGDLEQSRRWANAYATLLETDFFLNQQRPAPYSLRLDCREVVNAEDRPFDLVHLIDTMNRDGRKVNNEKVLTGAVADIVYHLCAAQSSDNVADPLDNLQFEAGNECWLHAYSGELKPRVYGSGAVAVLVFPIERLARFVAARLIGFSRPFVFPDRVEVEEKAQATLELLLGRVGRDALEEGAGLRLSVADSPLGELRGIPRRDLDARARSLDANRDRETRRDRKRFQERERRAMEAEVRRALRDFIFATTDGVLAGADPGRVAVAERTLELYETYLARLLDPTAEDGLAAARREGESEAGIKLTLPPFSFNPLTRGRVLRRHFAGWVSRRDRGRRRALVAEVVTEVCCGLGREAARSLAALRQACGMARALWDTAESTADHTFGRSTAEGDRLAIEVLGDEDARGWVEEAVVEPLAGAGEVKATASAVAGWLSDLARQAAASDGTDRRRAGTGRRAADGPVAQLMAQRARAARPALAGTTVWKALTIEAGLRGAGQGEALRNYITGKVQDVVYLASPLYNITDPVGIELHHISLLVADEDGYAPVRRDKSLPGLRELVSSAIGRFTPVQAVGPEAPYEISVLRFEYGAPLGLFSPLAEYRRIYRQVTETQSVPLLTDNRFFTDERYRLPDPSLAVIEPWRLAFLVAGHVAEAPALKRDEEGAYHWTEPAAGATSRPTRLETKEAFRKSFSTDGTLCRMVASSWNGLAAKVQREHLKEVEASLEAALAKGFGEGADAAAEREDVAADLRAVRDVITSERYWI